MLLTAPTTWVRGVSSWGRPAFASSSWSPSGPGSFCWIAVPFVIPPCRVSGFLPTPGLTGGQGILILLLSDPSGIAVQHNRSSLAAHRADDQFSARTNVSDLESDLLHCLVLPDPRVAEPGHLVPGREVGWSGA